jgi:hypothetical protein
VHFNRIASLILLVLFLCATAIPAARLHIGIDYRMIGTHFSDYYYDYYYMFGASTMNTWESFKLLGIKSDLYFFDKRLGNTASMEIGAALGIYFLNSYSWEVASYTGSGGSGICFGLDVPVRFKYPFSSSFTGFAGTGLSMFFINGSQPDDPPPGTLGQWFYDESFSESLGDIYLGLGTDFNLTPSMILSLGFRFTLLNLAASADYGMDPSNEGFSNKALTAQIVYGFGK